MFTISLPQLGERTMSMAAQRGNFTLKRLKLDSAKSDFSSLLIASAELYNAFVHRLWAVDYVHHHFETGVQPVLTGGTIRATKVRC